MTQQPETKIDFFLTALDETVIQQINPNQTYLLTREAVKNLLSEYVYVEGRDD